MSAATTRLSAVLVLLVAVVLGAAGLSVLWVSVSSAQALVADLSSHLIAISTGFVGTDVVLFGATDGPGEVAVVVIGPKNQVTVRHKERVAGIWMNRRSVTFDQVPSYYAVAVSRPLESLAPAAVLTRHEIGVGRLPLDSTPDQRVDPARLASFRAALIREKQRDGLYAVDNGQVVFLGQRLFRTTISFPAAVVTGAYSVGVFLIRDGDVVSAQTTPLIVNKVGLSAEISELAQRQPVLYGLAAVVAAFAIGWLAGTWLGRR
jgi:uncharacterized protein (TIGR02186 family)